MLVYKFKQRHYKSCSYSHGLQPYFIHVFVLCFSHGLQPLYFIHVFVLCFWFSHGLQPLYFIHVFVFCFWFSHGLQSLYFIHVFVFCFWFLQFLSCSFISISLTNEFLLNFPRCPCECLIEMKELLGIIHMLFLSTGSNGNAWDSCHFSDKYKPAIFQKSS